MDFKSKQGKFTRNSCFCLLSEFHWVWFGFLSIFILSGNTRQHLVLVVSLCLTFFCQLAFFSSSSKVKYGHEKVAFFQGHSSWHLHFLLAPVEVSPVLKVAQAGFVGVVKMWEHRIQLCCWLTCISCCIISFLTALHPPVKSWHWSSKEVLMVFFFSHSPAWWEPNGWGRSRFKASHFHCLAGCKARTFWMWSLAYFGKVIKFSEVGQLFLSLSGHTFNAWFVLNAVKVRRFLHEKVSPLWGNVW